MPEQWKMAAAVLTDLPKVSPLRHLLDRLGRRRVEAQQQLVLPLLKRLVDRYSVFMEHVLDVRQVCAILRWSVRLSSPSIGPEVWKGSRDVRPPGLTVVCNMSKLGGGWRLD